MDSMRCNLVKSVGERERKMTREQAKQFLIDSGVAEPTDEAISNLLNTLHSETKMAEDRANRYKSEADRVKDLEKELKALNEANLSDVEKANKATEEAMKEVAKLQQTVKAMELSKALAEIGIIGEDAEGLFENGELNTAKLGEIITNREKNAVAVYQKEALNSTPSPQGGSEDDAESKPESNIAKEYAVRAKVNTDAQNIINSYIGG